MIVIGDVVSDTTYAIFNETVTTYMNTNALSTDDVREMGLLYYLTLTDFYSLFYKPVISTHQKEYYGEVNTPLDLVKEMISFLPITSSLPKVLDSGAGLGYISACYAKTRWETSNKTIENWKAIMTSLTLIELNSNNTDLLRLLFGINSTIINSDFLQYFPKLSTDGYDIVLGNPPFNINGSIKVPTNKNKNKKDDGRSVWREFVDHSIDHCLTEDGYLCYFIPNLWMKGNDKAGLHTKILTQNRIVKIKCYSNHYTNRLFKGNAQTHCVVILLQKGGITTSFEHFSWYLKSFSRYDCDKGEYRVAIPVLDSVIENKINTKLQSVISKHQLSNCPLSIYKTSTLPKRTNLSVSKTQDYPFQNIKTCRFTANGYPGIDVDYSDHPCQFNGEPKLILAHGMYGIPLLDIDGHYGISRRDKYIILMKDVVNIKNIAWFLSTPLALYMFENYKYRMCYLEKAGFEWLIDVSNPKIGMPFGDNNALFKWFNLTESDIDYVKRFTRKQFTD